MDKEAGQKALQNNHDISILLIPSISTKELIIQRTWPEKHQQPTRFQGL
jgi:hypothetical protein